MVIFYLNQEFANLQMKYEGGHFTIKPKIELLHENICVELRMFMGKFN